MTGLIRLLLLLPVLMAGGVSAQEPDLPGGVELRQWVDRTTFHAGDVVTYHLLITSPPDIRVLEEDLAADALELTGLELVSAGVEREETAAGNRYHAGYRFTSYEVLAPALEIGERVIRTYRRRPGEGAEAGLPAGKIYIPATPLALASTLPAEPAALSLRDTRSLETVSASLQGAGIAGVLLILVAGLPLILLNRERGRGGAAAGPVAVKQEESDHRLAQLHAIEVADVMGRQKAYDLLDRVLRGQLAAETGIPAYCLTAGEILARDGSPTTGELGGILETCERARYGRRENLPSAEKFREDLRVLDGLLSVR